MRMLTPSYPLGELLRWEDLYVANYVLRHDRETGMQSRIDRHTRKISIYRCMTVASRQISANYIIIWVTSSLSRRTRSRVCCSLSLLVSSQLTV